MTRTNWSSIDRQIARKREYIRRVLSEVFSSGREGDETAPPPAERPRPDTPQRDMRSCDPFTAPPRR